MRSKRPSKGFPSYREQWAVLFIFCGEARQTRRGFLLEKRECRAYTILTICDKHVVKFISSIIFPRTKLPLKCIYVQLKVLAIDIMRKKLFENLSQVTQCCSLFLFQRQVINLLRWLALILSPLYTRIQGCIRIRWVVLARTWIYRHMCYGLWWSIPRNQNLIKKT